MKNIIVMQGNSYSNSREYNMFGYTYIKADDNPAIKGATSISKKVIAEIMKNKNHAG